MEAKASGKKNPSSRTAGRSEVATAILVPALGASTAPDRAGRSPRQSVSIAPTSASATVTPFTMASP
jgi:hypothetical protein